MDYEPDQMALARDIIKQKYLADEDLSIPIDLPKSQYIDLFFEMQRSGVCLVYKTESGESMIGMQGPTCTVKFRGV